jgi:hypothetical protein
MVSEGLMSERLVQRWEAVYREYGMASARVSSTEPGDRAVARHMARASADVAAVWREMAGATGMPWWLVAALSGAAQAFEYQSRDWSARARHDSASNGRSRVPHPQVTRPAHEMAGELVVDGDAHGVWSP